MPSAQRMQFLSTAIIILIGIWLTGFGTAHWFLYLPLAGLTFAAVTGICPSVTVFRKMGFK